MLLILDFVTRDMKTMRTSFPRRPLCGLGPGEGTRQCQDKQDYIKRTKCKAPSCVCSSQPVGCETRLSQGHLRLSGNTDTYTMMAHNSSKTTAMKWQQNDFIGAGEGVSPNMRSYLKGLQHQTKQKTGHSSGRQN